MYNDMKCFRCNSKIDACSNYGAWFPLFPYEQVSFDFIKSRKMTFKFQTKHGHSVFLFTSISLYSVHCWFPGQVGDLIDMVLDSFIKRSVTGGFGSRPADVMADTSVALASANVELVSRKVVSRILHVSTEPPCYITDIWPQCWPHQPPPPPLCVCLCHLHHNHTRQSLFISSPKYLRPSAPK